MDNGHKGAIFSSNPEMDDNLNTENWQESLKEAVPAGLPTPEQILPKAETPEEPPVTETSAIGTPTKENHTDSTPDSTPDFTPETLNPALGKIVQFPGAKKQSQDVIKSYNPANIKTEGDYLSPATIVEIDKLKEKLNQDGDLNSFYNDTRDLTEVNLDNSYLRKLYQQEGKVVELDKYKQERKVA